MKKILKNICAFGLCLGLGVGVAGLVNADIRQILVTSLGNPVSWTVNSAGDFVSSTATTQIVPGATSLAFRNNANNATNLSIADAGTVTFRGNISGTGTTPTLLFGAATANDVTFGTNSVDNTDNNRFFLSAGSVAGVTRGGYLQLNGNEQATAGYVAISTGQVAGSTLDLQGGNSDSIIRVITNASSKVAASWTGANGDMTAGGNITFANATGAIQGGGTSLPLKVNGTTIITLDAATNGTTLSAGSLTLSTAGKNIAVKGGGAAATAGTFTCNGVTGVVVSTTAAATSMAIAFAPNTISGTAETAAPFVSAINAGTSFTVKCSIAGDTSTYNWAMINVN